MKESSAMAIKDILPWSRGKREIRERQEDYDPLRSLQTDLNRAFSDFWRTFELPVPNGKHAGFELVAPPRVDLRETDREIEVIAELPGMDDKDVEVTVADGILTIRGEKKSEHETTEQGFIRRERSFGRFERIMPLPDGVDLESARAAFKNGVLTVTLAKTPEAQAAVKRVQVRQA
jgi:HSP20 family protein